MIRQQVRCVASVWHTHTMPLSERVYGDGGHREVPMCEIDVAGRHGRLSRWIALAVMGKIDEARLPARTENGGGP